MDDIDLLLDTDILVDVLRRYSPALDWARDNPALRVGIPVVVRMELLQGGRNQSEQDLAIRQLGAYRLLHLEAGDSERALQWFEQLHLRSGISMLDCLVAAIGTGCRDRWPPSTPSISVTYPPWICSSPIRAPEPSPPLPSNKADARRSV
jgi:predicted nucleic acid-binding protein